MVYSLSADVKTRISAFIFRAAEPRRLSTSSLNLVYLNSTNVSVKNDECADVTNLIVKNVKRW
jgi:hypothetical protein